MESNFELLAVANKANRMASRMSQEGDAQRLAGRLVRDSTWLP